MDAHSLAEKYLGVGEVDRQITDAITLRSSALHDENGDWCEFPVEITVHSNGNGDEVAEDLANTLRRKAYEAMDEVDERIDGQERQ